MKKILNILVATALLASVSGAAEAGCVTGAVVGGAAGGLVGSLTNAGVPEADANFYAEGVRRGGPGDHERDGRAGHA